MRVKLSPQDTTIARALGILTSPVFYEPKKYSIHAEQSCIKKCKNKKILKDSYMILVRYSSHQDTKENFCTSCEMCCRIIQKYKIRKVYLKCCK